MKHRVWIAIIFLIGCATGGVASQLVVPQVRAGTQPEHWEYFCRRIGAGALTAELSKAGAQGWELVSVAPAPVHLAIDAYTSCLKRALP